MVVAKYQCKQAELYLASKIGWRNCNNFIGSFTAYKPFYTAAFVTTRQTEITTAEAMPDVSVRDAHVTSKLLSVNQKAETCRNKFQDLKSYINSAYTDAEIPIKYQEAGNSHYNDATKNNWAAVENLVTDAANFITLNNTVLLANNNMPATFSASFTSAKTTFITALSDFYDSQETESDAAENKVIANNDLFDKFMLMCIDGQKIFRNDEGRKQMFTFDHLLGLVSNPLANLSGTITSGNPAQSLDNCEVHVLETDTIVTSDANGNYDFGIVAAGTYTVTFTKEGFAPQSLPNVKVLTGTAKKVDVTMLPA